MLKTPRISERRPFLIVPNPANKIAAAAGTAIDQMPQLSGAGMTPRSTNSAKKAKTSAAPKRPQGSLSSRFSAETSFT